MQYRLAEVSVRAPAVNVDGLALVGAISDGVQSPTIGIGKPIRVTHVFDAEIPVGKSILVHESDRLLEHLVPPEHHFTASMIAISASM